MNIMKTEKKTLNFFRQRAERIENARQENNPIKLESATGTKCRQNIRGETYFCGSTYGFQVFGDHYTYDGTLKFGFDVDNKKAKIIPEHMDSLHDDRKGIASMFDCVRDKIGFIPEMRQCYDFLSHSDSFKECENADHIRGSLTPHNLAAVAKARIESKKRSIEHYKKSIKEIEENGYIKALLDKGEEPKPWSKEKQKESMEWDRKQIAEKEKEIEEIEKSIQDKSTLEKTWDRVQENSLDRGFFFTNLALAGPNFEVQGRIISPIPEFLGDEIALVKQLASEALYACVPKEQRAGKRARKLEFVSM